MFLPTNLSVTAKIIAVLYLWGKKKRKIRDEILVIVKMIVTDMTEIIFSVKPFQKTVLLTKICKYQIISQYSL